MVTDEEFKSLQEKLENYKLLYEIKLEDIKQTNILYNAVDELYKLSRKENEMLRRAVEFLKPFCLPKSMIQERINKLNKKQAATKDEIESLKKFVNGTTDLGELYENVPPEVLAILGISKLEKSSIVDIKNDRIKED